ncbi:hypothetical protein PMIN06_005531 [Paraphaeosphaeria minitans]
MDGLHSTAIIMQLTQHTVKALHQQPASSLLFKNTVPVRPQPRPTYCGSVLLSSTRYLALPPNCPQTSSTKVSGSGVNQASIHRFMRIIVKLRPPLSVMHSAQPHVSA